MWALKYGRGRALSLAPEGPSYEVATLGKPIEAIGLAAPGFGDVPYLDVVVTHDAEKNTAAVFVMNRDLVKEQELELNFHDLTPTKVLAFETMTGPDLKAGNTFADPNRVVPQKLENPAVGSKMTLKLPARSYSVLVLTV
jgi:alpha-N-arabinofuranosidase